MKERSVTIDESGRSGSVLYREPAGSLSFYWELGGGDTVSIVQVSDAAWKSPPSWLAGQQAEILRFVAEEVIRQKAPGCRAEIDEAAACIRVVEAGPGVPPARPRGGFSTAKWQALRMKLTLGVLVAAAILAAVVWLENKLLVIDPGQGTPLGQSVRTDRHVATLIQTLEPYTPSLHRDPSRDRYRISLFLVPLGGGEVPRSFLLASNLAVSEFRLAKILGSDGRTLWLVVNGLRGVDLESAGVVTDGVLRRANPSLPAIWWEDTRGMEVVGRLRLTSRDRQQVLEIDPQTRVAAPATPPPGSGRPPFEPTPASYLSAGLFVGPSEWLGLHSPAEVERHFKPNTWLRRVVRAEDAKEMRRFYRGTVDPEASGESRRIVAMTPLGTEERLNAALLRLDDRSEPLRLTSPAGALMVYTSAPGLRGTLMVTRVDTAGTVLWQVDTGIDRFKLAQILPGERSMVFVGPRPMVPDKVSEPLLVIVDNETGAVSTISLWR